MQKTKEGYIDLTRADELLKLTRENVVAMALLDQRQVRGLPPRAGIPCVKCTYRDRQEAFAPSDGKFVVHKAVCDRLVAQAPREAYRIDPEILSLLIYQNEFEEEHVEHVASVTIPGTVIFLAHRRPDGDANIMVYLVDGTHRAVAALRAGRDFYAYVLVPGEAIKCMSHMDGKRNPHFIGDHSDALFDGRTVISLPTT